MNEELFILHRFGPGQTIKGVIRFYNGHDISPEQLDQFAIKFNKLNDNRVPKLGETFKIPLVV